MPQFYFNLPQFELLTPSQRAAIAETSSIGLSGGPGTGKSVVSLWRHIINHQKEYPTKSQLLTYTTTLAFYLKACTKTQNDIAATYVDSSFNWYYKFANIRDEIIIDEAQDLPLSFNVGLKQYSNVVSYGADNQQILKANAIKADGSYNLEECSSEESLHTVFSISLHRLTKNFRSTQRIMLFAKQVFHNAYIPIEIIAGLNHKIGELPRLLISDGNLKKQNDAILDIISQFSNQGDLNIAVLLPFESFGDKFHYTAKYYYELIINSARGFECSYYTNERERCADIKNIHVTTFKSAKGLEFDVVIIPNFHLVNQSFRVVNWRDFYVGVTRAKSSLFIISNNDAGINQNLVEKVQL